MIVSCSRRTDVPALYADWLRTRLRAGYADVPHPFDPRRVRRVDLRQSPEGQMDALVLWTRDPRPLLPFLPEWERQGLRTLWLVTLTGYPAVLEPDAPKTKDVTRAVASLAAEVGAERIAWRYDPVLLCPEAGVDPSWHRATFRAIASALADSTDRCILSLYDAYAKARRRLGAAGLDPAPKPQDGHLVRELAEVARRFGIEPQSCCEDLEGQSISPGSCIDGGVLDRLWSLGVGPGTDPGQRKGCRCAPSVDIGVYDTCTHGCLYCYATGNAARARERHRSHDPAGERLT